MTTMRENIPWRYSLTEVSEDKRTVQTAVRPGFMPEIVGTDMRVQGGLRVFPGFKTVRRLLNSDGVDDYYLDVGTNETLQTTLTGFSVSDIFSVSLEVGANQFVSGFVYRVTLNGGSVDVYLEFWDTIGISEDATPSTGVWRLVKLKTGLDATQAVAPMSVVIQGRLLYVMIEDVEPVLFYVKLDDLDSPTTYTPTVDTDTGPGPRPVAMSIQVRLNENFRRNGEWYLPSELEGGFFNPDLDAYNPSDILRPGTYDFAYQFEDSKTGRRSQLSELTTIETEQFNASGIPVSRTWSYDPQTLAVTPDQPPTFGTAPVRKGIFGNGVFVDTSKWDRVHWYRTVRVSSSSAGPSGGVLYRVKVQEVEGTGFPQVSLGDTDWLSDLTLVSQDRYDNSAIYLEEMPLAGAAEVYRNTLFTSSISVVKESYTEFGASVPSPQSGLFALRYSSLIQGSIELFPPDNRYIPEQANDKIIGFQKVGDTLLGLSSTKMYWIMKSGVSSVIRELHEGYGLVNKKAVTASGGQAFIVTYRGAVLVDQRGGLTGINVLDKLILEEWAGSLEDVKVVQDSRMGCIFVLNTSNGEAVVMWERTRSVSELEHCSFVDVDEGVDPKGSDDRRALCVTSGGWVMRPDDAREKDDGGGDTRTSMFDVNGQINVLAASGSGVNTINLQTASDSSWVESKIVVVSGARRGDEYTITEQSVNALTVSETVVNPGEGARLVVSPVMFRARGWMLAQLTENQTSQGMDLFRGRYVETMGAEFEGVSGGAEGTDYATYTARCLKGLSTTELASTQASGNGLVEGAPKDWLKMSDHGVMSNLIFPEIEVVCGDLDFRLLGFGVRGNIEGSDKTPRP